MGSMNVIDKNPKNHNIVSSYSNSKEKTLIIVKYINLTFRLRLMKVYSFPFKQTGGRWPQKNNIFTI